MSNSASAVRVSVVVIGRNEGDRLIKCLRSVNSADWSEVSHELIYVDSRSSDNSVAAANDLGATVIVVEDSKPNAAKARNLGWQAASGEFILFLDGDTELHPEFVGHALSALQEQQRCAAWGHRRESRPEQSLLTRVLDLDWVYRPGETPYFGGDVLVRRAALANVGGFDPTLNAGEEPELCARLRADGWRIEHIDVPMTKHDLALNTFRAYWLRAYRSGIAYAEVAQRMRVMGDPLWQRESHRDAVHALLLMFAPLLLVVGWFLYPGLALAMIAGGIFMILRTARRSQWKADGNLALATVYAVHVFVQKIPSWFGQRRWRKAASQNTKLALVDYKAQETPSTANPIKSVLVAVLTPFAALRRTGIDRLQRVWSVACLQEATGNPVDPSNVILGRPALHGTCNIKIGRDCIIYPGVYLETQGRGVIEIGNGIVLSTGVHIVAFERVVLGDGCMVGEYSSLRDANHNPSKLSIRDSGHSSAPIELERNVWIGRGASVLKGVHIGENSIVGANAVVTRSIPANQVATGVPARAQTPVIAPDNGLPANQP